MDQRHRLLRRLYTPDPHNFNQPVEREDALMAGTQLRRCLLQWSPTSLPPAMPAPDILHRVIPQHLLLADVPQLQDRHVSTPPANRRRGCSTGRQPSAPCLTSPRRACP